MLVALLLTTAPADIPPQSHPPASVNSTAAQSWSCSPRRLCTQIESCEEARWYLAHCSWGGKLDGDGDGSPCERLCGNGR